MHLWKVALTGALSASLGLVGCGGTDAPAADTGTPVVDAGPPMAPMFFVVNLLAPGEEDPMGTPGEVPGFNVDNVVSPNADPAGCGYEDYTAPAWADAIPGVDNQMGPILSALSGAGLDVTAEIANGISDGDVLILVELNNIHDPLNDPDVDMVLYVGNQADATCTMDSDCAGGWVCNAVAAAPMSVCTPAQRMALIQPDLTFDISASSYAPGTMTPQVSGHGSIVNGRAQFGPFTFSLTFPAAGSTLTLDITRAQLRFDINATGSVLSNGVLGGELDVNDLITTIAGAGGGSVPEALVRSILEAQADLQPDAGGVCRAVSVGLTLDGVNATKGVDVP